MTRGIRISHFVLTVILYSKGDVAVLSFMNARFSKNTIKTDFFLSNNVDKNCVLSSDIFIKLLHRCGPVCKYGMVGN